MAVSEMVLYIIDTVNCLLNQWIYRFVKFREDKELANDEHVVKKILKSIQDGVTKEQLLAHMEEIRAAWKAREKGIPMPEPVTKLPNAIKINTDNLSMSLTGGPMAATPAIISPSTNPFDTYTEKRVAQQGHRDSTSSIDYMPASRKNSLADSVKDQELSSHETGGRKQSINDDHLSSAEDTDVAEEKPHAFKNIQSPQWKAQSVPEVRKRSEERIDRLNTIRKQSDESSVKSLASESQSSEKVVKQEPKLAQLPSESDATDSPEGCGKDGDAASIGVLRPDMTLRQMVESKMPPKFRGSQGKRRSDSIKSTAELSSSPSGAAVIKNDAQHEYRDIKRSKSDSPSTSNHLTQEPRKLSLPQTTDESHIGSQTTTQSINNLPSRPVTMSPSQPVIMSPSQQPVIVSPSQSFNGKHMSEADSGYDKYRRRKMSNTKNIGVVQLERTQSPTQDDMASGKAHKFRKIDEQVSATNPYGAQHAHDNTRGGRYDAMSGSPPMQMSSATVRHQQMWEQRASPYTIPSSKATFAVPVSPYQQYATRNIAYNQYDVYDTQRRNSDEKSFLPHDQRHSPAYRHASVSTPPSRRQSQDDHYPHNKRMQHSSIADLLTTNVEVTPPSSSRQSSQSPSQFHHEQRSSSERANPFDFAKILHSPMQHPSDESSPVRPNGRQAMGTIERSPQEGPYSHQYATHTGSAIHFINYRADGNQVQALSSTMEGSLDGSPMQGSTHMAMTSKPYSMHSHVSSRANSTHPSPHSSTISSPDNGGYPQQQIAANSSSTYSSPILTSSLAYHSPQAGIINRAPDNASSRHGDIRQQQQRDHSVASPYRQASYPPYGYHSPISQHVSSPGRSRVDYPTAPPDRGVLPPDDSRYRRSLQQDPAGKAMKSYHEIQFSLAKKSPGARHTVIESSVSGNEEDAAASRDNPTTVASQKNNTKSKLDFILN